MSEGEADKLLQCAFDCGRQAIGDRQRDLAGFVAAALAVEARARRHLPVAAIGLEPQVVFGEAGNAREIDEEIGDGAALRIALDRAGQDAARQVFLRLVSVDAAGQDTRRRVLRRELRRLDIESATLDELLGRFGEYRLLSFDRDEVSRSPTVRLKTSFSGDASGSMQKYPRRSNW